VDDKTIPGACSKQEQAANAPTTATVGPGAVVAIVLTLIVVVGLGVFFYMRHRQRALKQDIDSLLKQYLPMSDANSAGDAATKA
jgi:uncharacterized protein HemX